MDSGLVYGRLGRSRDGMRLLLGKCPAGAGPGTIHPIQHLRRSATGAHQPHKLRDGNPVADVLGRPFEGKPCLRDWQRVYRPV